MTLVLLIYTRDTRCSERGRHVHLVRGDQCYLVEKEVTLSRGVQWLEACWTLNKLSVIWYCPIMLRGRKNAVKTSRGVQCLGIVVRVVVNMKWASFDAVLL